MSSEQDRQINDDEMADFIAVIRRLEPYISLDAESATEEKQPFADVDLGDDNNVYVLYKAEFKLGELAVELWKEEVVAMSGDDEVDEVEEPEDDSIGPYKTTWYAMTWKDELSSDGATSRTYREHEVVDETGDKPRCHYREWRLVKEAQDKEFKRRSKLKEETDRRFTKERYDRVMPMLRELGPQHLVAA